jgi:hypothetical protein
MVMPRLTEITHKRLSARKQSRVTFAFAALACDFLCLTLRDNVLLLLLEKSCAASSESEYINSTMRDLI